MVPHRDRALEAAAADFPGTVETLKTLVRIPSCSFPGSDPAQVERSATACALYLTSSGFPEVRRIQAPGGHPCLLASDRRAGPGAFTLLLYAHHDVQPPLDRALWSSDPFDPVERNGRLHGRGTSDDKAGIAAIAATIAAWTAAAGRPPINLVALIDGEEEIGSPHLSALCDEHADLLRADALAILDASTLAAGLPCLTTSLRGLVVLRATLRSMARAVHSGLWGGPVPDPALALSRLLAALADDHGQPRIPDLPAPCIPDPLLADLDLLPHDPQAIAAGLGLTAPGVCADRREMHRRLWYAPSLSINALHAGDPVATSGNVVNAVAAARIGLRLAPGMPAAACQAALERQMQALVPPGFTLDLVAETSSDPWLTDTAHPVFAIARQALAEGFGSEVACIGSGGTIPFVDALSRRLGGIPALLLPVGDPSSNPHGPDESLDLAHLRSLIRSLILLTSGLAASRPRAGA